MLISIDPGLRICGLAVWSPGGELVRAELVRGANVAPDAVAWINMSAAVYQAVEMYRATELVVEFPQTYRGRAARGDTNDLLQLAAVVGAICSRLRVSTHVYRPSEWKGQVAKEVTAARVDETISEAEKQKIIWPAASLRHNVVDAIGIGLKHLRRR